MKKAVSNKILIVNDEEALLDVMQSMLSEAGYRWVYAAATGDSGLRALRDDHEIKLVLLDNILPDMDGMEFLSAWIRQGGYRGKAFVVMAGFWRESDISYFQSMIREHTGLTYAGLVEVPFLPVHLLTAVERALRGLG